MKLTIPILVLLNLLACSSTAAIENGWTEPLHAEIIPSLSNEVPRSDIFSLSTSDEEIAIPLLEKQPVIHLDERIIAAFSPSLRNKLSGKSDLFLVRAAADDMTGTYSVFQKQGALLVLYGHFGKCGKFRRAALIVRQSQEIKYLYAGCSGSQ